MPLEGTQLLPRDVAQLLFDAGWVQAENLLKMIATADAESNLYSEAYHINNDGTTDWGYLQLNDGGKTGAELDDFKAMAFDPVRATAYARGLYVARGFQPWVAYNSGAWTAHIARAARAIENMFRVKYGLAPL